MKGELRGCIQDVKNISNYLFHHWGFQAQNACILTDDQTDPNKLPTHQNILKAVDWLVQGAKCNDSLVFHYSGRTR
jgi:hypothetical protein